MQAWVRTRAPRPQVTEQSDHTDHGVQPPSTGNNTQGLVSVVFKAAQGVQLTCVTVYILRILAFSKNKVLRFSLCLLDESF